MFPLQKKLIPFESRGKRNSVFFGTERILILHFHKTICVLQLPIVLTPFLTFQLSSGMHCRTFFVPVFLQDVTGCYLHVDSFCLTYLNLKL